MFNILKHVARTKDTKENFNTPQPLILSKCVEALNDA